MKALLSSVLLGSVLMLAGCNSSNDNTPAPIPTPATTSDSKLKSQPVEYVDISSDTQVMAIQPGSKIVFKSDVPDFYEGGTDVYWISGHCGRLARSWDGDRIGLYKINSMESMGESHKPEVNFCLSKRSFTLEKNSTIFPVGLELEISSISIGYTNTGAEVLKVSLQDSALQKSSNMTLTSLEFFGENFRTMTVAKLLSYHLWNKATIKVVKN